MLATSSLRLDMMYTAKNITKTGDVKIKQLRHTADLYVHVVLFKVSNITVNPSGSWVVHKNESLL